MIIELLLVAVVTATSVARQDEPYKEYGTYDVGAILKTEKTGEGRDRHFLDMELVNRITDDLAAHAKNYPPTFRSEEEQARAARDVKLLADVLDVILKPDADGKDDAPADMLLRIARLRAIGHNLDVKDSAAKAVSTYERLLQREPDHALANYHYGVFLSSTAAYREKAVPYLEKALKLGVENARYSLALNYLSLGDENRALLHLEEWVKLHPDDEDSTHMIEAIKTGRVERKPAGQ